MSWTPLCELKHNHFGNKDTTSQTSLHKSGSYECLTAASSIPEFRSRYTIITRRTSAHSKITLAVPELQCLPNHQNSCYSTDHPSRSIKPISYTHQAPISPQLEALRRSQSHLLLPRHHEPPTPLLQRQQSPPSSSSPNIASKASFPSSASTLNATSYHAAVSINLNTIVLYSRSLKRSICLDDS